MILVKYSEIFLPLNPNKKICKIIDIIHFLLIFFYNFIFPFEFSFRISFFKSLNISRKTEENVLLYSTIFFFLNIILSFNKSYYKGGFLITKRSKIIKHYIRNILIIDILGFLPFIFTYFNAFLEIIHFFKMIFLIKYLCVGKIFKKFIFFFFYIFKLY